MPTLCNSSPPPPLVVPLLGTLDPELLRSVPANVELLSATPTTSFSM